MSDVLWKLKKIQRFGYRNKQPFYMYILYMTQKNNILNFNTYVVSQLNLALIIFPVPIFLVIFHDVHQPSKCTKLWMISSGQNSVQKCNQRYKGFSIWHSFTKTRDKITFSAPWFCMATWIFSPNLFWPDIFRLVSI